MLKNFNDDELRAELERREKLRKEKEVPKQLPSPNFEPLKKICQDYIDELARENYADEDFDHYIFETAIECVFGKKVWDWINSIK